MWLACCSLSSESLAADHSATPRRFRWGGDREGGGPFIYSPDDEPTKMIGFEVDLAAALAERMQRNPEFVQANWNGLLAVLSRGNIDVALNGYEYSEQRAAQYQVSLPYYIYELGLCVAADSTINRWEDLKLPAPSGEKRRVAVLEGSAADRYLSENYGADCHIVRFEGSVETFPQVALGQLDATVQDLPTLQFYVRDLKRYPKLKVIEEAASEGFYVMYCRPEDRQLVEEINQALKELHANGQLQAIYERYGIWNQTQLKLENVWNEFHPPAPGKVHGKWKTLAAQVPLLIKAAGTTILLALAAMPLAVLIGLFVALVRAWESPALGGGLAPPTLVYRLLRFPCTLYVEIVRGTPLAFQLFVVYFILPEFHLRISEFWAGVVALAVNYSAYEAEIFRLGLQAIPKGQIEASLSLGMPRLLAVRRIILPQAVRLVIPATANDFIALFKDTAVCSVIAVEELSKQYAMGARNTGLLLEMAALTSILYLAMSYPLSLLSGWLERKLRGGVI